MSHCVVVSGLLNAEGGLELNEQVLLPAGPVRVSIEPMDGAFGVSDRGAFLGFSEEELRQRKAEMTECVDCLTNEEAQAILEVIEREFEQVNLDEWR